MKKLILRAKAFITAIIDKRTEFASVVSVIGNAAAEAIAGDVIPLDVTGMNLGMTMSPVYLVISVAETILAAGGAANVTFKMKSDVIAALTEAPVTHFTTGAIAKADLTAGTVVACVALPLGDYKKYLGVTFTPDTNNITAGKINAYLTMDPPNSKSWKSYPAAGFGTRV